MKLTFWNYDEQIEINSQEDLVKYFITGLHIYPQNFPFGNEAKAYISDVIK